MKKFEFTVGNPPYHEDMEGERGRRLPLFTKFMDEAYSVSRVVTVVTPARFLFNAGLSDKQWNKQHLDDTHFTVLQYNRNSQDVFEGADIKGGVAVTCRNPDRQYGALGVFTEYAELNSILQKVQATGVCSIMKFVYSSTRNYTFTAELHKDYPDIYPNCISDRWLIASNAFEKMRSVFLTESPDDGQEYIQLLGREGSQRVSRWVLKRYISLHESFSYYKVMLPAANGTGAFGEPLSMPIVVEPCIGSTQTFTTIGKFQTRAEADGCLKYLKTRFARAMLGVLKVTHHNSRVVWQYVPMQDFTEAIWGKSIAEIDEYLFRKYGLEDCEVAFLKENVREMA